MVVQKKNILIYLSELLDYAQVPRGIKHKSLNLIFSRCQIIFESLPLAMLICKLQKRILLITETGIFFEEQPVDFLKVCHIENDFIWTFF